MNVDIIRKVKFYLNLLRHTIVINPVKIIFLVILSVSLYGILNIKTDIIDSTSVITEFQYGNQYIYIYVTDIDIEKESVTTKMYDSKQKVVNGKIYYEGTSAIYVVSWVGLVISIIIILIIMFSGDGEWDFDEILTRTYLSMVDCEIEDKIFFYILNGRLIYQSQQHCDVYYLRQHVSSYVSNRNIYPKFKTIQQRRESSIESLLT